MRTRGHEATYQSVGLSAAAAAASCINSIGVSDRLRHSCCVNAPRGTIRDASILLAAHSSQPRLLLELCTACLRLRRSLGVPSILSFVSSLPAFSRARPPRRPLQAPGATDAIAAKLTTSGSPVVQLYRYPGLSGSAAKTLLRKARAKVSDAITGIDGEACYNVGLSAALSQQVRRRSLTA